MERTRRKWRRQAPLEADAETLRARLERLEPASLAALLVQLGEQDAAIRERVEALALRGNRAGAAAALARRLERIADDDSFIPYRASDAFARELEGWLEDVGTALLPVDPEAAWSLVDRFVRTDARILERADDSNGSIGDVFRRAHQR